MNKPFRILFKVFTIILIFCVLLINVDLKGFFYSFKYFKVTQYASVTGSQSMFYTIETPDNRLILIDGGYSDDVRSIRSIIKKHNNHVDAWILTHPHTDHISAFNDIFMYRKGITIDKVYTSDYDYDDYKQHAQAWDDFSTFEYFKFAIKDASNVSFLHVGDELDICGLKANVLNSYGFVDSPDRGNDGSLMIKLSAKTESILFCGDVGVRCSDKIIEQFADLFPSDYVQMGHHGNGGLSEEFYRMTQARYAFFDAPDWLMTNRDGTGSYTTPSNAAIMRDIGAKIYSFNTCPNHIWLK